VAATPLSQIAVCCQAGLSHNVLVRGLYAQRTQLLPAAKRGQPYQARLKAADGGAQLKWKKDGTLPKGLKMHKNGEISGTVSTKAPAGAFQGSANVTSKVMERTKKIKESKKVNFDIQVM
jgi:hypothetical protein